MHSGFVTRPMAVPHSPSGGNFPSPPLVLAPPLSPHLNQGMNVSSSHVQSPHLLSSPPHAPPPLSFLHPPHLHPGMKVSSNHLCSCLIKLSSG